MHDKIEFLISFKQLIVHFDKLKKKLAKFATGLVVKGRLGQKGVNTRLLLFSFINQ